MFRVTATLLAVPWLLFALLGAAFRGRYYCDDIGICDSGEPLWAGAELVLAILGIGLLLFAAWGPTVSARSTFIRRRVLAAALVLLGLWLIVFFPLQPAWNSSASAQLGTSTDPPPSRATVQPP
jgi:hypothetical protein